MNDLRYYIDLLNEDTAEQTVDKLAQDYPDSQFNPLEEYQWAKDNLKISNRIDWFVTVLKYMFLMDKSDKDIELNKKEKRNFEKAQAVLGEWRLGTPEDRLNKLTLNKFKDSFIHFYGFPYDKIQRYSFQFNQPVNDAFNELKQLEEEYLAKQDKEAGAVLLPGDYWLMKFSDGLTWYYLNRGYCEQEGKLGAHCGNIAGKDAAPWERLLSLRNESNQVIMTFSLDPRKENNILGEMKAKGNTHPDEKYHPHIMALLLYPNTLPNHFKLNVTYNTEHPIVIKGFDSTRRIPGYDFSVFDLAPQNQNYLDEYKPELVKAQIGITPVEILSADKTIQKNHIEDIPEYIVSIIKNPHDSNNWVDAVDNNPEIIIYVPQSLWGKFPLYEQRLIPIISADHMLLMQAPRAISRNTEIMKKLVSRDSYALEAISTYIKNYEELCEIAVNSTGRVLEVIPMEKRSYHLCKLAVNNNPHAIRYIPTNLPQYEELCIQALLVNMNLIWYIEKDALTQNMCNYYIEKGGDINNIPNKFRTKELYQYVINKDPNNIRQLPNELPFYTELAKLAVSKNINALDDINTNRSNFLDIFQTAIKGKNLKELCQTFKLKYLVAAIDLDPNNIELFPPTLHETPKRELYKYAIKKGYPKEKVPQELNMTEDRIVSLAKKIAHF